MRRERRERREREQGLSLVELLVAMLVLGILAAIVSGLYVSSMRSVSHAEVLTANTRSVSNGMNEMARVIRAATDNPVSGVVLSAPALEAAGAESVTFYAYVNLGTPVATQPPVKVRLNLDANRRLVETKFAAVTLTPGFYGFSATPVSRRILTEAIAPAGTPSLFRYLQADGTTIVPAATGLTLAERRLVTAVQVSVTVTNGSTDARTWVTLQNTVGMPNVGLSLAGL
ncbi:type II secretion system protein [Cryobacterium melibiosiphilum]|uniref:Type II secretion system protein n=1 Tax=Cryobacterium melibiosiphilum TaxID=995039 RepID=A0A3A5MKX7_9MICO|nr:type II secretion system protein [Cryobacterium melibiosiphilum]RJT88529.1 type II secretion system protein [Cryobacterium melibiosiphilum]